MRDSERYQPGDFDAGHKELCAMPEFGVCTCKSADRASEASAPHAESCPMPLSGDCTCSEPSETYAAAHLEAMRLLGQAEIKIHDALTLLGKSS